MNLQTDWPILVALLVAAAIAYAVLNYLWSLWFWPRYQGTVVGYKDDGDGEAKLRVSFAASSGERFTIETGSYGAIAKARKKFPQGTVLYVRAPKRNPARGVLKGNRVLGTLMCVVVLAACVAAAYFAVQAI